MSSKEPKTKKAARVTASKERGKVPSKRAEKAKIDEAAKKRQEPKPGKIKAADKAKEITYTPREAKLISVLEKRKRPVRTADLILMVYGSDPALIPQTGGIICGGLVRSIKRKAIARKDAFTIKAEGRGCKGAAYTYVSE